jgi:Na+/H+-dicarboxylate symporter
VTTTAATAEAPKPRISPTTQIVIGLVLGVALGYVVSITDPDASEAIRPFAQLFIRMIQMIIAPLLFATLVGGIAGAGHFKDVGRMGLRAIIYFEVSACWRSTC